MTSTIVAVLWTAACCTLTIAEELMRHGGFLVLDRPNAYARSVTLISLAAITLAILAGHRFAPRWISAVAVAVTFVLFRGVRYNIGTVDLPIDFKWLLVYAPPWMYGLAGIFFAAACVVRRRTKRSMRIEDDVLKGGVFER